MERADVDDPSVVLLKHHLADLAGEIEHAVYVGVHDALPGGVVGLYGGGGEAGGRVVNEDIDAAELGDAGLHGVADLVGVGDVAGNHQASDAQRLGLFLDFLKLLHAAGNDGDICPLLGQT